MSGIIHIYLSVWVDMFYVCLVYGKSSVTRLCVVMWGVVGGGLIVVCRCGFLSTLNYDARSTTHQIFFGCFTLKMETLRPF